MKRLVPLYLGLLVVGSWGCGESTAPVSAPPSQRIQNVFIILLENKNWSEVKDSPDAPYLNNTLLPASSYAESYYGPKDGNLHPSEPNYLALFSGSTQGVTDDSCPHQFPGPSLGSELIAAGQTFSGYSEGLPAAGSGTCNVGSNYARRHVPWTNFSNVPPSASRLPMTIARGNAAEAARRDRCRRDNRTGSGSPEDSSHRWA